MSADQLLMWAMAAMFALGAGALLVLYRALRVYDRLAAQAARDAAAASRALHLLEQTRPRPKLVDVAKLERQAAYGTPRPAPDLGMGPGGRDAPISPVRYDLSPARYDLGPRP